MTGHGRLRERLAWSAAVAVLATSLVWLAAMFVVLLFVVPIPQPPEALVMVRALARVALRLAPLAGRAVPTAILTGGLAAALMGAMGHAVLRERRMEHA
jgi:hypothetical protein